MLRLFSLAVLLLAVIYTIEGTNKGKACAPVKCPKSPKVCAYGYQKKDGCEICRCNDPCNPPGKAKLCGTGKKCHVEKKTDGTFEAHCVSPSSNQGKGKDDKKATAKTDCNLPKEIGHCRAILPRYYYNPTTKACESFNYGGCGGNGNNFKSKVECEKSCKA